MKLNRLCSVASRARQTWFCLTAWMVVSETPGEGATPDKSHYTLFCPVPAAEMRELSTDRPDKTESPYTVDAGHFQIEMDLVTYTDDRHNPSHNDTHVESWSVAPVNLQLGLCDRVDFQLILEPHNCVRTRRASAGTVRQQSGFGDVTTRLKVNCWGNDGGATALALMPFVTFPTSQDGLGVNSVAGGVIFPLAVELPRGWGLGLMTEVDFFQDADQSGYHPAFINSVTFSHDLVGPLGGYVEFFSEINPDGDSRWVGTVDLGLTYGVTRNLQLDGGVNIGVTESADDLNLFVGLSWRL